MSIELIRAEIKRMAVEGKEGISITVLRNGKVFGVDIDPSCWDQFGKVPFEQFSECYLLPAFEHLAEKGKVI